MKELKYQQVCRAIRVQIAEGFWKQGNRIYSERQLAEIHDISRPTVKRALSELVQEGLLEYKSGRQGMFVSEINNQVKSQNTRKNKQFIGVAIDNHTPAFASHLLQGIHDALWDNGFHTIYCNTYHANEHVIERIQSLIDDSVAGVIYSPVLGPGYKETNKRVIDAIDKNRIPIVLVDRYLPDHLNNHVVINNREAFHNLVTILLKQGHSRILFANGFNATSTQDRLKGFHDAFKQMGIDSSGALEISLDEQELFQTGRVPDEIIKKVDGMGEFTALIGHNQLLLEAGQQIAKKLGRRVVTVACVATPREKISDIAMVQPIYQMGCEAAKLLVKLIENESLPITQLTLKARIQDNRKE